MKDKICKLLELGNRYAADSDWKDFALVKFCLCAMGVLIGIHIPRSKRKRAAKIAVMIFLVTYIPLMRKVYFMAKDMWAEEQN